MKLLINILIMTGIMLSGCSQSNPKMNEPTAPNPVFPSMEEAVNKGKSDFVELLRQKAFAQADLNPEALEKATLGTPLETFQVDFDKLMDSDSMVTWAQISGDKEQSAIPLLEGGRTLSTVEVAQNEKGWSVVGLNNNNFIRGIRAVQQALKGSNYSKIALYEVPNIRAKIYVATTPEGDVYFADYPGRYSLGDPIPANDLFRIIKGDALEFNKKFGDQLKKQKLVD